MTDVEPVALGGDPPRQPITYFDDPEGRKDLWIQAHGLKHVSVESSALDYDSGAIANPQQISSNRQQHNIANERQLWNFPTTDLPRPHVLSPSLSYTMPHGPGPPIAETQGAGRRQRDGAFKAQELLRDAREELLGVRFGLRAKRKDLTGLRQKTSTAEGRVLDQLRKFVQSLNIEIPEPVAQEYSSLSDLRDMLGYAEVQYDEDEQVYNDLEIRYTKKERDFFKEHNPAFEDAAIPNAMFSESGTLNMFANGSPQDYFSAATQHGPRLHLSGAESLDSNTARISDNRLSKGRNGHQSDIGASYLVPDYWPQPQVSRKTVPSICSESALLQLDWLSARKRIDMWIWDSLQSSPLQQAMLKQYISEEVLGDPEWWSLVKAHWNSAEEGVAQEYDEFDDDDSVYTTITALSGVRQSTQPIQTIEPTSQGKDAASFEAYQPPLRVQLPLPDSGISDNLQHREVVPSPSPDVYEYTKIAAEDTEIGSSQGDPRDTTTGTVVAPVEQHEASEKASQYRIGNFQDGGTTTATSETDAFPGKTARNSDPGQRSHLPMPPMSPPESRPGSPISHRHHERSRSDGFPFHFTNYPIRPHFTSNTSFSM